MRPELHSALAVLSRVGLRAPTATAAATTVVNSSPSAMLAASTDWIRGHEPPQIIKNSAHLRILHGTSTIGSVQVYSGRGSRSPAVEGELGSAAPRRGHYMYLVH